MQVRTYKRKKRHCNTLSSDAQSIKRHWHAVSISIASPACIHLPSVTKDSGCPGHLDPIVRKLFKSSIVTLYPAKWSMVYWRAHACPLLKTKRSRFHHFGLLAENVINSFQSKCAMGAHPMGAPGCPLLAASGWSALTARIVLMHLSSNGEPW